MDQLTVIVDRRDRRQQKEEDVLRAIAQTCRVAHQREPRVRTQGTKGRTEKVVAIGEGQTQTGSAVQADQKTPDMLFLDGKRAIAIFIIPALTGEKDATAADTDGSQFATLQWVLTDAG
jgi:hypothetical protein